MSETPDIHQLARQVAVLEERMATKQAEYETGLERIAGENRAALERNNAAFERLRADMANREAEGAKREARLERTIGARDKWLYGLLISVLVAVVLILIRQYLPDSPA